MNRHMLFTHGQKALQNIASSPYQETLSLLNFSLNTSSASLLSHLDSGVSTEQAKTFFALLERRTQGEPLAYLTKRCEFWSLLFTATPDCLIPRADTELLVEQLLTAETEDTSKKVLELGTGSGAIAISLSLERPNWQIVATDQSQAALTVAQYNAKQLNASVDFREGNWFEAAFENELFDIIISNPPYLGSRDSHLKSSLRYEPQMALVGGEQGTEVIKHLVLNARHYLTPGGFFYVEQGFDQARRVKAYLIENGYTNIRQYRDLQGILRVSCGQYSV